MIRERGYYNTTQVENVEMMGFISEDCATQVQDKEMLNTYSPVIGNTPPPAQKNNGKCDFLRK
jgi:hypothetical protein